MRLRLSVWLVLNLIGLSLAAPVRAQGDPPLPPMAAASAPDTLVLLDGAEAPRVIASDLFSLPRATWSPDGRFLTYAGRDDSGIFLMLTDFQTTTTLADLSSGVLLPATFNPEGTHIYYAESAAGTQPAAGDNGPELTVDVYRRMLAPLGEPERIGALTWSGAGCGGGSALPMDFMRIMETGFMGNDQIFHWTRYGIVHSVSCNADGLGLFDLTSGTSTVLVEDFARSTFSPDGSQIAGVRVEQSAPNPATLAIYDLDSRSVYPMQTQQPPDQVVWAGDGAIYYSTRTELADPLTLEGDATLAYGVPIPAYEVTLNWLNRISGEETEVFRAHAWGIGRLESTAFDLYFSVIPSGHDWLAALASGELPLESAADFSLAWAYVAPELHKVSLATGESSLLGAQIAQFVLRPTG